VAHPRRRAEPVDARVERYVQQHEDDEEDERDEDFQPVACPYLEFVQTGLMFPIVVVSLRRRHLLYLIVLQ